MRILVILLMLLGPTLAQGVRTALNPDELDALLRSVPYRYERVEKGGQVAFLVRLSGLKSLLLPMNCEEKGCTSLMLTASFGMKEKPSLERINAWNRERRFSRAYLDEEGDPVLEADLDLEGGVADRAILAFIDLFEENLRAFASWIGWE
ncbi:hypothetical protein Theos_2239 (plasmid) [Thermus oshimai JL-2]|uniref:Bacterial sensory transduction regulator n=1 Tax=Thermus oshimai JL-2 TaxID=751945 RepID=K7R1N2_THEOS|nr:YbjN domain-containing protein [Thermus oshimai]AFV77230.1 hypothetical protein Theos_2239 [Thermus oshimai JL-2]